MRNVARILVAFIVLGVLAGAPVANAEIYKCKEADGSLTYSQTPCPNNETNVVITGAGTERIVETIDCRHAHRFASDTARSMREGAASTDVFDHYGGVDSLSSGSISIINYVYVYKTKPNVSIERIAGLVESQCEGGSMERVTCADLPIQFTDQIGGCATDTSQSDAADAAEPLPAANVETVARSNTQESRNSQNQHPTSSSANAAQCRQQYQNEIDAIDARMRSGYSSAEGDNLRDKRRELQQKKGRC